ncbi:hypothetical protein [Alicyclobacillus sp. ALC3]|nr:hypothetical protein [Alicyclobacillus sp. ALC3]WDL97943.1 hypothetical protein JC200_04300 [Alicyclobacillus sp. ALC3]
MSVNALGLLAVFGGAAIANELATTPRQQRLVDVAIRGLKDGLREATKKQ